MAQDEDKTTIEASAEAAKPVAKAPNKLMLFGGIGLGAVIIGVALALFVLKPLMAGSGGGGDDAAESHETARKTESHKPSGHGDKGDGAGSLVYAVKDIVVNPAGTGGTRFLSVSLGFELGSSELEWKFEEREPLVRDALITILSSKTVAQLTDAKQKEITRYQIKKRLEQLLETDQIAGVYYTDFVLQ
jgi:flagellar FliL protein